MSIEKKSLISNRIATKKAIATKPTVSEVGSTKLATTKIAMPHTKVAMPHTKVAMAHTRVAMPHTKIAMPNTKVKI